MNGMALGRTLANGEREVFLTGDHVLRYYRQGQEMKLIAEAVCSTSGKVLNVSTADLDGDGVPEVYLTIMDGEFLSSQVWAPAGDSLKRVTEKLPYFFRGIALAGKEQKIYAQEKGINDSYYGDVYELVKSGDRFTVKNPLKLPRFGNLYNFNTFTDPQGKSYFVIFNHDGYVMVYSQEMEDLWKSSDKFSGSELYFRQPVQTTTSGADAFAQMVFLDQRITVTREGELIVPQNSGFWTVGNSRSYSKNSVYSFAWNGSALVERWHTPPSQNYLADYAYDEARKELVLLEVVKKEGLLSKGASAVSIKKVE